jgi:hypothetical protein
LKLKRRKKGTMNFPLLILLDSRINVQKKRVTANADKLANRLRWFGPHWVKIIK